MNNKQSKEKPKAKKSKSAYSTTKRAPNNKLGAEMLEANHSTDTKAENDELQKIEKFRRISTSR